MSYCYINGEFLSEYDASIPLTNLGVQRGFGIFDLFRTRDKKPSFMEDYLDRFDRSQRFLHLNPLISGEEIRLAVEELQNRNGYLNSTFKLMLLGSGDEEDEQFSPFFYILNKQISDHLPVVEASVITHEYLREYPEVKSLNYQTSFALHQKKVKAKAVDVIYHNKGLVTEASRSNLFIVKDGVIKTSKNNILAGITRKQVLQFAPDITDLKIEDIPVDEMLHADEVFITSTYKQVMPIVKIDDKQIGKGKIGIWTNKLLNAFLEVAHS